MKTVAAAGLVVLALYSAAMPAPATTGSATFDHLRDLALERSGGDLGQAGLSITNEHGARVSHAITGAQFLADLQPLLARFPVGPHTDHVVAAKAVGFGINDANTAKRLGWPFCDYASIFVVGADLGDVIARELPLPLGDVSASEICGGFYGQTQPMSSLDVTVDLRAHPEASGCGAAEVLLGAEITVGKLGGYNCSWRVACLGGEVVWDHEEFFGLTFDYLLGGNAHIVLGDDALDAPACA